MSSFAIVFPGQGSQQQGMLSDFQNDFPQVNEYFQQASDALGYDLWDIVQNDAEKLNRTEYTQPALLTASVVLWEILKTRDLQPTFFAGHSLGEYSALVCANALSFSDAVKLVSKRGQLMQEAVKPGVGAMAAIIGLDDETVATICMEASAGEILSPANFNAIGQVVIAGHVDAVDRAIELAKKQGAKIAKKIPVSVPSHCELMRPAAVLFEDNVNAISINTPQIPVVQNVDVTANTDVDKIRANLIAQLYFPVRWVETIQYIATKNVTTIIECGPGKVLTGLIKRIDKSINSLSIGDRKSFDTSLEEITCN